MLVRYGTFALPYVGSPRPAWPASSPFSRLVSVPFVSGTRFSGAGPSARIRPVLLRFRPLGPFSPPLVSPQRRRVADLSPHGRAQASVWPVGRIRPDFR